jgi:hypothetical protein
MSLTTKPKPFCFILMPFTDDFDDIYQLGIKQSCLDAGAYCERVDEQIFNESILDRIYNQISKADVVIADMTNRNANVFYEVGYAHALGKTTILLTKNSDDIPFDLKHYPHIIYNNKISKLKKEITTKLKWCVENNNDSKTDLKIDIDIFIEEKSLSTKDVEYKVEEGKIPTLEFVLHNQTFKTYNPEDYRLGIITDKNYPSLRVPENSKTIKLPDGNLMHMCPINEDILYPNSYTKFKAYLNSKETNSETKEYYDGDQEVIIRIFTPTGTRDFYLNIVH